MDQAFIGTPPAGLEPGLYLTDPQGHAQLVGATHGGDRRNLLVMDMAGGIDIGGIWVTDPDTIDQLGDRLKMLAGRLREFQANPYRPGATRAA